MSDSTTACAWGGCRGSLGGESRRRTRLASLASSDDPGPAVILRRIHVRGVVESLISPRALPSGAVRPRSRLVLLAVLVLAALPASARAAVPRGWMGAVAGAELGHHVDRVAGQFDAMADAGVQSTKAELNWARIEPHEGALNWGETDIIVASAAESGLSFMPTIVGAPKWAGTPLKGREGVRHPRQNRDFARFLRVLVGRYGPDGAFWAEHPDIPKKPIRSWEIWNEPDIPYFWRRPWV